MTLPCTPVPAPVGSQCRGPSLLWCRKLNKLGTFSLSQLGKSKSPIAEFMRNQRKNNDNFEESLLKLVRSWLSSKVTCVLGPLKQRPV